MPDEIPHIPRHRGKQNKPIDSRWRQQRLLAWRPSLTIRGVTPTCVILGLVLLGIGICAYFAVNESLEEIVDYTDCANLTGLDHHWYPDGTIQCEYTIVLKTNFKKEVKFYYKLDNFYQNFRQYLSSRNDLQFLAKGKNGKNFQETDGCEPLSRWPFNKTNKHSGTPFVPCGFIANSMFNDSFALYMNVNSTFKQRVPFTTGLKSEQVISQLEMKRKFQNPTDNNTAMCEYFNNTLTPPWWQTPICLLGMPNPSDPERENPGVAFQNVDFMTWMKPAALPDFRKLYRFLDTEVRPPNEEQTDELFRKNLDEEVDPFEDGLQPGNYTLRINYNYPVKQFNGRKYFIIAHETWIGPRNFFLPVLYMITGAFIVTIFVFLFTCDILRRKYIKKE